MLEGLIALAVLALAWWLEGAGERKVRRVERDEDAFDDALARRESARASRLLSRRLRRRELLCIPFFIVMAGMGGLACRAAPLRGDEELIPLLQGQVVERADSGESVRLPWPGWAVSEAQMSRIFEQLGMEAPDR